MASTRERPDRPLSPHLQIYRPLINMIMSIVHRITGIVLYAGTAMLAGWLLAAASGPQAYDQASAVFGSVPGRLILAGYTWALMHHMLGGMRHLVWDTGRGFELATIDRMAWGTLAGSAIATLVIWGLVA